MNPETSKRIVRDFENALGKNFTNKILEDLYTKRYKVIGATIATIDKQKNYGKITSVRDGMITLQCNDKSINIVIETISSYTIHKELKKEFSFS